MQTKIKSDHSIVLGGDFIKPTISVLTLDNGLVNPKAEVGKWSPHVATQAKYL